MKIDWKKVSQCPGYISMKETVANEARQCDKRKWCKKPDERYAESFRFAINRAKHYAFHLNKSIEEVLNEWEEKRNYSFMNYYQECNQPKFHNNNLNPKSINAHRKYYKTWQHHSSRERYRNSILRLINEQQVKNSTRNKKARWNNDRKKRAAYIRSILPSL